MHQTVFPHLSGLSSKKRNPNVVPISLRSFNLIPIRRIHLKLSDPVALLLCLLFVFVVSVPQLQGQMPVQQSTSPIDYLIFDPWSWSIWGGNGLNTHNSSFEHTINPQNVSKLTPKWVFTTAGEVSATPTVRGDSAYFADKSGYIYRVTRDSGKAEWIHKISEYTGIATSYSRNSPVLTRYYTIVGDQASAYVVAFNRASGQLVWKNNLYGAEGAIITSSPVVYGDRVFVGISSRQEALAASQPGFKLTFRGSIVCLDLETGKVIWRTYMVPPGYTGGAVWESGFPLDDKNGSLFFSTGNNYSVPADVANCIKNASDATQQLACLDPHDYIDAIGALDPNDGHIKWVRRLAGADTWTVSCIVNPSKGIPCPDPAGGDYDFGSGPNLFTIPTKDGGTRELVGAGQKSGIYWALDALTGEVVWATQVGPGDHSGGIMFGSAIDATRAYVPINNASHTSYTLGPDHKKTWNAGSWAALDLSTGKIIWQIPATGQNPLNSKYPAGAEGQLSEANGVVYAGSLSGDMVAIDAVSGNILWKFASGGSVVSGPSILDGVVYWGSGYGQSGVTNNKVYAFGLPQ